MTSYSLTEEEGTITFWTDNEELRQEVMWLISLLADGISWRNQIRRVVYQVGHDDKDKEET